jgi:hypothetical protein
VFGVRMIGYPREVCISWVTAPWDFSLSAPLCTWRSSALVPYMAVYGRIICASTSQKTVMDDCVEGGRPVVLKGRAGLLDNARYDSLATHCAFHSSGHTSSTAWVKSKKTQIEG